MATEQQLTVKSGETDVTSEASYTSSNEDVATVSSGGLISSTGPGEATVTATYNGQSGTCAVTVTEPDI